jgi:hypothetical protein
MSNVRTGVAVATLLLCLAPAVRADSGTTDDGGSATDPLPTVARNWRLTDVQVTAFDRGLRGETEAAVASRFGSPDEVEHADGRCVRWCYQFGGRPLTVTFQNGRATGARACVINREEQERQTGVREDDFVGQGEP